MIKSRSREPGPMSSNQIVFFDTTLRDGEQSPGCTMHHEEKLRMAHQLAALRVDVIEAGFPIPSDGDFESVRVIARQVKGPRIAALARAKREDIESAARAVEPASASRIPTFLSSSDIHLEYQMKISREQALDQAAEAVRLSRTFVEDVEFSPMDATYTAPDEYAAIFRLLKQQVPGSDNVIFSTHCHDDLGMAVANSLAGIEGGARQVECAI